MVLVNEDEGGPVRGSHPGIGSASFLAAPAFALVLLAPSVFAASLFAIVDTGELYQSSNGGASWVIRATIAVHDAVGLAASSSASNLTMMTRSGSVYQSGDGGLSWSGVGAITASDLAAFTILPDSKILALTASGTLYQSADGGVSFTGLAALTSSNCVSLIRGPLGRLYALARTGEVYQSNTNGTSWTVVGAVPVSNAVAIQRKGAELFVLTETGEVYRSLNDGVSWVSVGAITASNLSAMAVSGGSLVVGARTGEVYQSATGTAWAPLGAVNQLDLVALGSDEPLATGVQVEETTPRLAIRAPYPNPALGGEATFPFTLDRPAEVRLELYDVQGRLVASRASESLHKGAHGFAWAPKGLGTGRYFVRYVVSGRQTAAASWVVLR
jgi:hypothetical protein